MAGHAGRGKSAGDMRYLCNFFYRKMHNKKCLTLKMKVKVTEYNIRHGLIRWKLTTSGKATQAFFAISHHFLYILISKV